MPKQQRVVIENVNPQLQCGHYFIKRVVDEQVTVYADVIPDGHDIIQAEVVFKHESAKKSSEVRMFHEGQDVHVATFKVTKQGFYEYFVRGWVDYALNWQHGIEAKLKDGQHVKSELLDGVQYLKYLQKKVVADQKAQLQKWATLFDDDQHYDEAIKVAASKELHDLFVKYPQRILYNDSAKLKVYVDRKKANFSTWYEFFPRSSAPVPGQHGTFKDCEKLLPRIAQMGFDTLYFPPIHPIGEKNRKGKNNTVNAKEGDSGVPWAIGSKLGGHKAIHPELGTEKDFKKLIKEAKNLGIEIAMDIAFQAAPDHPYVEEYPEWFRKRPDGTIQYAENPPKKYQDIVNFYFETKDFKALWQELLSVVIHWVNCGVHVFRVDNPHTKPYFFWNWLIAEVKKAHPDVLFLAEAFSRPKVMQQLAKQGFSQSYTYFTWRVGKQEIMEYVNELSQTQMKEYYRPNFWPNTPDINPYHLQGANEAMHCIRYALAGTLSGNLGIYGPVFEYMVTQPMPNKEEYLDCEKYEIRHWDWSIENKVTRLITKINQARHQHASLQQTNNVRFCYIENNSLLAFYKWNDDKSDETLIVISLDPHHNQQGFVQLPLQQLQFNNEKGLGLTDLITSNTYVWRQEWNFVELSPALPFHIFHLSK
ncbi:MAG: alpha-1,4-glucan--maltose-1-phosphate maltosyltransferase [Croceitalea sp.]|nr:alpha-1,4-glucan--maltose-1-phosphate maltosyltransferase [Croceitalea sp.]